MKIILGALLLYGGGSFGSETIPYEGWVYSLYPASITRNKVLPFIEHLNQKLDSAFTVNISSDATALLARCSAGQPALIFSSLPLSKKVEKKCGYHYLAVTYQDVFLYALKKPSVATLEGVRKLGVVGKFEATKIALGELNSIGKKVSVVEYSSFYELIKNFRIDHVDGAILPSGVMATANNFSKNWVPVYKFKGKGVATAMVAPQLDVKIQRRIADILLSNDDVVSNVFQQGFGIGAFESPQTLEHPQRELGPADR